MGTSRLRDSVYSEISSDPESGTRNNFEYGGAHIPTDDEALDSRSISPVQDLDPAPLVTDTSNSSSDSDSSPLGHSLPTVPCSISISTDSVLPHDNAASTESQANYTTPESICSHTKRSMKGCTAVQYMIEWWLWELCGIGLSISTVVAVVALAINLDGTLLNDWKHGLSPNAVISALITVAKTAMLFALAEGLSQTKWLHFWERQEPLGDISVYDDASRGPWGSLKFLRVSSRCKPSMIACVGAIITLLVQAMGPVAQQIVVFDTQSVQQFGVNSSLLVTKTYNVSYLIYDVLSESLDSINSQRAFQHALLDGLIKANVPLGFTCQSGNCSWPNFSTLGMCRNYTDVSSMTNVNIVKPALGSPRVNFTTSSGFQFLYDLSPIIGLVEGEVKLISDINANFVELQFEDSSIKPDDASFIRLIMVQQGSRSSPIFNGTITATDINATITECIINWCARTYQNFSVVGFPPLNFTSLFAKSFS